MSIEAGSAGGGNPAEQPWPWSNARRAGGLALGSIQVTRVIKWGSLNHHRDKEPLLSVLEICKLSRHLSQGNGARQS